jgi:hypothetical protein
MSQFEPLKLKEVAFAIEKDWVKVSPYAQPYLDAMKQLDSINDSYYADTAKSVVLYFLANASSYRGESAKPFKAYLKGLVK